MTEPAGVGVNAPAEEVEILVDEEIRIVERNGEVIEADVRIEEEVIVEPLEPVRVRITVNDQFVVLHQSQTTGLGIKEAAIADGVPIQPDFALSEVLQNGKQKNIADDKPVHLKDGDQFWAIPGDDNS